MTAQIIQPLARILAASSCDLGDERDVMRTLRAAGIPDGDIIVLMDEVIERARILRHKQLEASTPVALVAVSLFVATITVWANLISTSLGG